jgi:hypothetical protein
VGKAAAVFDALLCYDVFHEVFFPQKVAEPKKAELTQPCFQRASNLKL